MIIHDKVYGSVEIKDKVIIDLINSKAVQRMKKIKQAGISAYILNHGDTTRYEHCVGVYLLLKRFNAPLKEQIAGLLHDIPHTALSHVTDLVFNKKNYHEELHKKVMLNSDIPKILKNHGFEIEDFLNLDEGGFPLLEQPKPDLCADRIDYCFRDGLAVGIDFVHLLEHLTVVDNQFVFTSKISAIGFGMNYLKLAKNFWGSVDNEGLYALTAKLIREALELEVITKEDLLEDDEHLINKLKNSQDTKIKTDFEKLKNIKFKINELEFEFHAFPHKFYIDPLVLEDGKIVTLSSIDHVYKESINKHISECEKGYKIQVLKDFTANLVASK